jgi:hypothetical protein
LPHVISVNDPLVEYIALATVGYWKFTPAKKDRRAVPVSVTLPVVF